MNKFLIILIAIALSCTAMSQSMPVVIAPTFKKDTVNIEKLGAVPHGFYLNTKNIQDAIDTMAKKGGGVVLIPSGLWLTGPVILKSNINLHLAIGATLLFTKNFDEYPLVKTNWEGLQQMRNQSPVSATDAANIAITGNGIIDGNGDAWRMVKKEKLNESQWKKLVASGGVLSDDKKIWYPSEKSLKGSAMKNPGAISSEKDAAFYAGIKDFLRPNMIVFSSCKNILLEGVTFQNSPAWCIHPLMCENVTVKNISVKNPWYAQNGDGIDLESCKNVLIENSVFDVGDDALCMKSGRDAEGRKRAMPVENVIISGCTVYAAHGGFVIGSEMSGGARNIHVSNCTFIGTDIGLRFKTNRGRGGVVENIFINDIFMKNIGGEAILFDMYYEAKDPIPLNGEKSPVTAGLPQVEMKPVDETTPVFKNIYINDVYVNGAEKALFVRGLPEMHIKDIVLKNMVLQSNNGIDIQEASNFHLKNVTVLSKETNPVIDIIQSDLLVFDNINFKKGAALLFRVNGDKCSNISIKGTEVDKANEKIRYELGAQENSATITPFYSPENNWAERMAATVMNTWPDSFALGDIAKWSYDMGVILKGFEGLWRNTGNRIYFDYIQRQMDFFVNEDGSIRRYRPDEYNIDQIMLDLTGPDR